MVQMTTVVVAIVLAMVILVAALLILSGVVPSFREGLGGISQTVCNVFKVC